jgi:hypothetical protein
VIRAREGHHHVRTTFAIESNDSQAPGIVPEPVRVHDQPIAPTRPRRPATGVSRTYAADRRTTNPSSKPQEVHCDADAVRSVPRV